MAKRLIVEGSYGAAPDALFSQALSIDDMKSATAGFAHYEGNNETVFKQGQTYVFDVTIWKRLKNPSHSIYVETVDQAKRIFKTLEKSEDSNLKRWDHTLTVLERNGQTIWRDDIVIDAGWKTFAVIWLAKKMYKYRHTTRQASSIRASVEGLQAD